MSEPWGIALHTGDLLELIDMVRMASGVDDVEGLRQLIAVEQARGTRYYTATVDGRVIGAIGVYVDAGGRLYDLEPPQVIDFAVAPEYRRQGLGRVLMATAEGIVRAAGKPTLWLYTDGNDPHLLTVYRRLGFRLAAAIPDWFGPGTNKAIFRKEL